MLKMAIVTAHAGADSLGEATKSWIGRELEWKPLIPETDSILFPTDPPVLMVNGSKGMLPAYQHGYWYDLDGYDILAYFHDDLIVHDGDWKKRVLKEFEDPSVGMVGFGGATGHGQSGLYRDPYNYKQLARSNFLSNMTDAENHGKRFTGSCDVAVLDGFALIFRREVLEKAAGWPLGTPIGYVSYDYWASCMTRRLGYRIRVVGCSVSHLGGRTFVALGMGQDEKHWTQFLESHKYIAEEFRDVLPYTV